jgi:glycosyltransferase involved in cell wall biosynthesis
MGARLELIVTHWNEPWVVCEKFFQMLDVQRGMRGEEVRVTLVQDGQDTAIDTARLMKRYPFLSGIVTIPHGGISAARNAGIDAAQAEWIMFCDCDDMFYTADALRRTLDALEDAGERADLVWAPIVIENRTTDGVWYRQEQGWNHIFIHGKCYRLAWIREKGIRFDERLAYSEDSLWGATVALEIDPERIGKIREATYMWCLRGGSCTSDQQLQARNRENLARHRCYMPEICMARGRAYEALTHAARGIFDAYHELCGGTFDPEEREKLEGIIGKGLVVPWGHALKEIKIEDGAELLRVSYENTQRKRMIAKDGPDRPLGQWLIELKEKYGERENADDQTERAEPGPGRGPADRKHEPVAGGAAGGGDDHDGSAGSGGRSGELAAGR